MIIKNKKNYCSLKAELCKKKYVACARKYKNRMN